MRGNVREDVGDRLYKSSSIYAEQRYRLIEGGKLPAYLLSTA